jgi:hypothetical protein
VQLLSWGDGSDVPTSGQDLVIAGTDNSGLLRIRTFDAADVPFAAASVRTDTYEAMEGGTVHLVSAHASGDVLSDQPESGLPAAQARAIADLKQQLPGLLPPQVLSGAERDHVLGDATLIIGQTPQASSRGGPPQSFAPGSAPVQQNPSNPSRGSNGSGGYPLVPSTGPTLPGAVAPQRQLMPVLLAAREPALALVPALVPSFGARSAPGSPATAAVVGLEPGPDVQMPSQLAYGQTIQAGPPSVDGPGIEAGLLAFLDRAADASILGSATDGGAGKSVPGMKAEVGRPHPGDLPPVFEITLAPGPRPGDGGQEQSRSHAIVAGETRGPRLDQVVADPAVGNAPLASEWLDVLMNMDMAETTRRFAVFCVVVGAVLAWKSHQSIGVVARKAASLKSSTTR